MIRTRFAPSPTGALHIGGIRTALYSWLFARHHHGEFILRIEDTDTERSTEESTQNILSGMRWLGMDCDQGPFFQHQRKELYTKIAEDLLSSGHAYYCYCSKERLENLRTKQMADGEKPRYDHHCRDHNKQGSEPPCIRFKTPLEGKIAFQDAVYGEITTANHELDDFIIMRSNGNPTYNFTVVVDDIDMQISHVIRGNDHISNTPRQIHIIKALNKAMPTYAHVPMIIGQDGKRLSKRDGAASILEYKERAYLPEAILNYLVRLGWSHGDQEIFSLPEMIDYFSLEKIGKSPASFNLEKLDWLNSHYQRLSFDSMTADEFIPPLRDCLNQAHLPEADDNYIKQVFGLLKERVDSFSGLKKEVDFICIEPDYTQHAKKAKKHLTQESKAWLESLLKQLSSEQIWTIEFIKQSLNQVLQQRSIEMKQLGPVVRFAVTAGVASPDLATTLLLIRHEPCRRRITHAIEWIAVNA